MFLGGRRRNEHARPACECREKAPVWLAERHRDRQRIIHGYRLDESQLTGPSGTELRVAHAVEIVLHRLRVERRAIVEGDALVDVEGEVFAVLRDVP